MDEIFSVLGEEYVEPDNRCDEQHTYCCHNQIEVDQMVARVLLDEVIALHVGHT